MKIVNLTLVAVVAWIAIGIYQVSDAHDNLTVELIRGIDGDTFKVNIPNYPEIVGSNISIRIAGIDTPELRGRYKDCPVGKNRTLEQNLAKKAKIATTKMLMGAEEIVIRNLQRANRSFRIVADVYVDGANLGDFLIKNGFASEYIAGHDWCGGIYDNAR